MIRTRASSSAGRGCFNRYRSGLCVTTVEKEEEMERAPTLPGETLQGSQNSARVVFLHHPSTYQDLSIGSHPDLSRLL